MKCKIVGKEKFTQKQTNKAWTNFHLVTSMKCQAPAGSTYGGNIVMTRMLDYEKYHDDLLIGKEYEAVIEERMSRDAKGNPVIQSVIIGFMP